ncbi:MAG: PilN domain-containing protein [Candidatus Omnitrophica bacterium]|nr:PilN domain-containing protein [Candidatus Omnitrophota bacterium]MDD5592932.1 PilN domain-containing protein [Candidatus Omnitrophota bacterium]
MGKRIVGLDIDENSIVATELFFKEKGKVSLGGYKVFADLKSLSQDPFLKKSAVVMSLPTQAVLFRTFRLAPSLAKGKGQARAKDHTAFLLHQNLPFKLEECFWDTFTLSTELNLIAVKKEVMHRYVTQVEELGLKCLGVAPAFVALYNVLIYNYPEKEKEKWAILNIRSSASDLLIYEDKRLWLYPLSMGSLYLEEDPQAPSRFSLEIQQIFNTHYLQNPSATQKRATSLNLCGRMNNFGDIISPLRDAMGDFEIKALEPLRKIDSSEKPSPENQQPMALSLGVGLTYLKPDPCFTINLIKEKIKAEVILKWRATARKAAISLGGLVLAILLLLDISLFNSFQKKMAVYKNINYLSSSVSPQVRVLKDEKEKLQKMQDYLGKKLGQQELLLKALAEISRGKPKDVEIQEVEAKNKEGRLLVDLSGSASDYEDVNIFLVNLKKNEDIKDAKIFSSTFPSGAAKAITFKLHFEAE